MPPTPHSIRFARYGALAFEFTGTILGGVVVGWLIDRQLHIDPWGVMVCTLVAVVSGFVRMIQMLRRFDRLDRGSEP